MMRGTSVRSGSQKYSVRVSSGIGLSAVSAAFGELGMIGSVERYSPTARKRRFGLLGSRTARIIIIAFILYIVISHFFVSTFRIDSVSMSPSLKPSDKVLVSYLSFGARVPLTSIRLPGLEKPARGDLVVVQPPFFSDDSVLKRIFEPIVSFVSFQRVTLYREFGGARAQGFVVKRIIGVPGDTLRMRGFKVMIRRQGSVEFVPESQLTGFDFSGDTGAIARNWSEELPLSGNSGEITLANDEYFVLGDNRPDSSDSRSWGPVKGSRILAKLIMRYWPFNSFGKL
jgi:signal peptidase I